MNASHALLRLRHARLHGATFFVFDGLTSVVRRGAGLLGLAVAIVSESICAVPARAVVVYQRPASGEIVAAGDDGSHPRVIAHGAFPAVSPDGRWVVYIVRSGNAETGRVLVVSTRGGRPRLLMSGGIVRAARAGFWSPNGRYLVVGGYNGAGARLIDMTSGRQRRIPLEQDFGGATFSPNSTKVLIGEWLIPDGLDLYLVQVHGKTRSVSFGSNLLPLWGRAGLAYERDDGDRYSPPTFSEISLADRTHGPHRVLLRSSPGLLPTSWSRDGSQLLVAQVTGNTARALLLDITTHQQRTLPVAFTTPDGVATISISRDGQHVIGEMNGNVVTETSDGTLQLLAQGATTPTWSR